MKETVKVRAAAIRAEKREGTIITIPASIRDASGIEYGDVLEMTCTEMGKIELRRLT